MPSPADRSAEPPLARVAVLVGLLVALTIVASSAVAVALPTLADELGTDLGGTAWVLACFSLTFSVASAVFGRVADIAGLALPLRVGVTTFAAGSLLAALAPNLPVLLVGRLLQGTGAGAVPVTAMGVLLARAEGPGERARALGLLGAVVALISGSGPLVGGGLATLGSWRLVLGLPALALLLLPPIVRLAPPPDPAARGSRVDATGAGLTAAVVTATILLLQSTSTGLTAPVVAAVAVAGVVALVLLTRHSRRSPQGFLPAAVIGNRRLLLLCAAGFGMLAAYLALLLALPQLLRDAYGWTPLRIGLTMLPAAVAGSIGSRLAGRLAGRVGRYRLITGLAVSAAAGLCLAGLGAPQPPLLVAGLALVAVPFAAGQTVLIDTVPALVDEHVQGIAIGVFNLVFFTGGAVGSATTGGLATVVGLPAALAVLAVIPLCSALAGARAGALAKAAHAG